MNASLLESPSRWRAAAAVGILLTVAFPSLAMLTNALAAGTEPALRSSFWAALQNGATIALTTAGLSLILGLPLGILIGRYRFPFRDAALALVALPLLLPTFLWAIGWSSLPGPTGFAGVVLSFSAPSASLVLLTALVSARSLSASQVEAAFLAGGERAVLSYTARYVTVPSIGAAALAGLLSLSDPGPAQIFGLPTAAGEVLTSFSAFYDFNLASRQCLALAGMVLAGAVPLSLFIAPSISSEILVRQTRTADSSRSRRGGLVTLILILGFVTLALAAPLLGLTHPVLSGMASLGRASRELVRTAEATAIYAVGSGVVATTLGMSFAAAVGRSRRLRSAAVAACFVLFAVPPALTALAFVQAGTHAPQWADILFRSRFGVTLAAGMRFFPVAALLALRAWNTMPRTWALAGAIHGAPLPSYVRSVVLPFLAPSLSVSVAVCGLLATADVVSILLVHPPGQSSLPLTIFTIMANAPQAFVAALCLVYVAAAAVLLAVFFAVESRRRQ